MATFRTRGLRLLDRLLQFEAGSQTAPTQFEVTTPIQPVWDLSRENELGAVSFDEKAGGFWQVGSDNVHAGAGGLTSIADPYTDLDNMFGPGSRDRLWAWLFWAGLTVTGTGVNNVSTLNLRIGALGNALQNRDIPLALWNAEQQFHGQAHSTGCYWSVAGNPFIMPIPIPIPVGSTLGFYSLANGAGTIRLQTLCWAGPLGVYPPSFR